jgi:2TM domain
MPQDWPKRAFLIHIAVYLAVVAICAAVNFWLAQDRLWFIWVAAGWGIGIAAHALAFWLRNTRRRERVFIDPKARGFAVHLFAYVAVILLLFILNVAVTPKVWWFYWVALGWGAGVAAHGRCVFFRKRGRRRHAHRPEGEAS